ncbi:MAG: DUF1566 domain-containing protein [Gammaproteobacteria bacterium]|nr:DUF1566 domain-containing protein [Gammaproteobacteria bacterium]
MVFKLISGAVCACLVVFSFNANAALYDRGGGLIYDDVLKITWLQDANFGAGSVYEDTGTNGLMYWDNAWDWAGALSYFDSVRNTTWDDWRLPATNDMHHLYFQDGISTATPGPFFNIQSGPSAPGGSLIPPSEHSYYWSGLNYSVLYINTFTFDTGNTWVMDDYIPLYAWAVRDGDVAETVVAVPAALWLFSSGLLGLIGLTKRKAHA